MNHRDRIHVSVLLDEVLESLDLAPGKIIVDGTLGAGGHTRAIAERIGPTGTVLALDRDPEAIAAASENLKGLPVQLAEYNFCELPEVLTETTYDKVDGIILDLGFSSDQLADNERGFSFDSEGPLDLRFNKSEGEPASGLVNRLSQEHLADLIYQFGEERLSRRIARKIIEQRKQRPIKTAKDLSDLLRRCVPVSKNHRIHPATRTFQALRIAVNEELKSLDIALRRLPDCLSPQGRLVIISFHSLEDRRVKEAFRDDDRLEVISRKPIRPTDEEIDVNPRSRSAKLRVASRL
ncbi:MAG: 16S rRNA (cytosine1402-N4)-methyltransferase [Pirellulaceae bacterium]